MNIVNSCSMGCSRKSYQIHYKSYVTYAETSNVILNLITKNFGRSRHFLISLSINYVTFMTNNILPISVHFSHGLEGCMELTGWLFGAMKPNTETD